ncbi:hypothetical protein [Bacillus safensis]|uniref:hypothetical protein n=1 Tax=Bacillus safensis TaxID=561879 RepID=UPI003671C092
MGKSETKIKNTIYINITKKSETKKQKIAKWCENQPNLTNSVLSLIEHAIDRFGYEDVTDHDVERKLYIERLHFDSKGNHHESFDAITTHHINDLSNHPDTTSHHNQSKDNVQPETTQKELQEDLDNESRGIDPNAF